MGSSPFARFVPPGVFCRDFRFRTRGGGLSCSGAGPGIGPGGLCAPAGRLLSARESVTSALEARSCHGITWIRGLWVYNPLVGALPRPVVCGLTGFCVGLLSIVLSTAVNMRGRGLKSRYWVSPGAAVACLCRERSSPFSRLLPIAVCWYVFGLQFDDGLTVDGAAVGLLFVGRCPVCADLFLHQFQGHDAAEGQDELGPQVAFVLRVCLVHMAFTT